MQEATTRGRAAAGILIGSLAAVTFLVVVSVVGGVPHTVSCPSLPTEMDSNCYSEGTAYLAEYDLSTGAIGGLTFFRPGDTWVNPEANATVGPVLDVPVGHAIANVTDDPQLQSFLHDFWTPGSHVWRINTTTQQLERAS